jgi:hypothetical protein
MDVNTVLGSAPLVAGVASFTTSGLRRGTHQITAEYGGDSNNLGNKSARVQQRVH